MPNASPQIAPDFGDYSEDAARAPIRSDKAAAIAASRSRVACW